MNSASKIIFLVFFATAVAISPVFSATLTVESRSGEPEVSTIEIPITVDDPESIVGASFTVVYPGSLSVTVNSSFFDTFNAQFAPLDSTGEPVEEGSITRFPVLDENGDPVLDENNDPVFVETPAVVDNLDYYQPLLTNLIEGEPGHKKIIAAARCVPAVAEEDPTLFVLNVSLKSGEPGGTYDIEIIPTTMDDPDLGYDNGPETIDLVIGYDRDADDNDPETPADGFSAVIDDAGYEQNVETGTVTFDIYDSDNDGMADAWEIDHFGDLSHDGSADTDQDGYSDLDEHENGTIPTDGTTQNDPPLTGYDPDTDARVIPAPPVWTLDIDGNGEVKALTDGILVIRYLLGSRGDALIDGALGSGAIFTLAQDIENQIESGINDLDIDGNGETKALTDGILVIRYLLGTRGDSLIDGAMGSGASRTVTEIEAYIDLLMP